MFFFLNEKTAYEERISAWSSDVCSSDLDQAFSESPTCENFSSAELPRKVIATMHTTAIRATRRAYSTSEAPRSVLATCAWIQALRMSNCSMGCSLGSGRARCPGAGSCQREVSPC